MTLRSKFTEIFGKRLNTWAGLRFIFNVMKVYWAPEPHIKSISGTVLSVTLYFIDLEYIPYAVLPDKDLA